MKIDPGDGRESGDGPYTKPTLGTGPHEGCVYTVAGSSGHTGGGSLNHPIMVSSLNVIGSVVMDVSGNRLDARFIDGNGTVRDGFTIMKGTGPAPDTTPPAAVADLSITGTTGNSLSLRWTAPGDDGNTGTASSYDIRYSTAPITTSNWTSATQATGEPAPVAAGTAQIFTVGGLLGSQTYYVALRATDDRGNVSALSNVVNGTTADTTPPAAITSLR
jgi:hypothetical protein